MGAVGRFRVQQRIGAQWEHVGICRTWKRVLELVGVPSQKPTPDWVMAGETPEVRVHLRSDAEFRVVENLTSKSPGDDVVSRPLKTLPVRKRSDSRDDMS